MTRLLLRWLNPIGFILLIMLGVAIQTSFFNSYPLLYLQPDVVLIAVIWCAFRRGFTEGGILALILANIAEIHSSAPSGLFMMSYISVYLLVRLTWKLFVIPNVSSLIMLTLAASVFWKLEYLGILYLLGWASNQWRHTLVLLLPGAVMEGIVSIWLYRWFEKFDLITFKNMRSQNLLEEDEIQMGEQGI
jgi:hypothetical protein